MSRVYQLSVTNFCPRGCSYCSSIGNIASVKKTEEQMKAALCQARSGEYQKILLPCHFIHMHGHLDQLRQIISEGFEVILQVNSQDLYPFREKILKLKKEDWVSLQLVVDQFDQDGVKLIKDAESWLDPETYLIVVRKNSAVHYGVSHLSRALRNKLRFYFPFNLSDEDPYLSTPQIGRLLDCLNRHFPNFKVRPPEGLEIYEPRVDELLTLEAQVDPTFQWSCGRDKLKMSIVISVFNDKDNLICTLRHLFEQDVPQSRFEVVVVDDGSDDGTQHAVKKTLCGFADKVNLTYVYFPRIKQTGSGDGLQYRAGISRNLGVKYSQGEMLCFLGSDILTPPHFVRELFEEHKVSNVIQIQPYYLNKRLSSSCYAEIDLERDTSGVGDHWLQGFYRIGHRRAENDLEMDWKCLSLSGLSLPKKLFKEIGWFRKTYIFSEFEAPDLGYRLHQAGEKLYLSEVTMYRLCPKKEHSGFRSNPLLRLRLQSDSAKIFLHNSLDIEAFQYFKSLIDEPWSLKGLGWRLLGWFFKEPLPEALKWPAAPASAPNPNQTATQ